MSNIYHELAQVYTTNNPAELRSLVSKHSESFTRDNNTGLVKQCVSSLYKKNIQRLTKVGGPEPEGCPQRGESGYAEEIKQSGNQNDLETRSSQKKQIQRLLCQRASGQSEVLKV